MIDNRLKEKAELKEQLLKYKEIFSQDIYAYLKALLELEFSVIKPNISQDKRNLIANMAIYRDIALYNIYHQALNLANNMPNVRARQIYNDLTLRNMDILLWKFDYNQPSDSLSKDYEYKTIGQINLYRAIEDKQMKQAELERVKKELEELYEAKNPYSYQGNFGGPRTNWEFEHLQEIRKYETLYNKLAYQKELTDEEKEEMEITQLFYQKCLDNYDLTENDFTKEKLNFYPKETLVKHEPNLTLTIHKKYL